MFRYFQHTDICFQLHFDLQQGEYLLESQHRYLINLHLHMLAEVFLLFRYLR